MTNEEYIKAIDMRTSRRTYKARALDKSILEVLKNMVDAVNEASGLEFQLVEDGTPAFKIFSGRFSYIAVCGEDSEAARVKSGYWGESIVLHAFIMVWVPVGFQALMMKIKFTKQLICQKSTGFMP